MSVLVIAEHDNQSVKSATLNTVAAAARIGGDVVVLVAGSGCGAAAKATAAIAGVRRVLAVDAPHYKDPLAENLAPLVVGLAGAYTHVLLPANSFGKNLAPRIAALLDVAQISDIVSVVSADTFVRPIYAGNALATLQSKDRIKIITVRTTGFDAASA
ncbi:MAG TPA: electron transfer flavoprotein subunit alpha/FixB family protein, partial [Casimicrobiaceae bacterium]